MAILKIARMGHPVLYEPAEPVADPTAPEIARLAADMRETLEDIGGSGLAAPQVFVAKRVVVYRPTRNLVADHALASEGWTVMVNPVLRPRTEEIVMGWERCLSIPGLHGKVPRYPAVQLSYQGLDGGVREFEAEGAVAAVLQHECDHLDGILYPMRMPDLSLLEFDNAPGRLAADVAEGGEVWPLFERLVEAWPGRQQWTS